jgi:hypothetical protein
MERSKVKKPRNSVPEKFSSVEDAVEFWHAHSLADYEESWKDVQCEIDIKRRTYQISVDGGLYQKLRRAARARGVSADTLVNLWLQEKGMMGLDSTSTAASPV